MFDFTKHKSSYIESEDMLQLKSDSKLADGILYQELAIQEKCEQITAKWVLLDANSNTQPEQD